MTNSRFRDFYKYISYGLNTDWKLGVRSLKENAAPKVGFRGVRVYSLPFSNGWRWSQENHPLTWSCRPFKMVQRFYFFLLLILPISEGTWLKMISLPFHIWSTLLCLQLVVIVVQTVQRKLWCEPTKILLGASETRRRASLSFLNERCLCFVALLGLLNK